jgi:hypothetical protein
MLKCPFCGFTNEDGVLFCEQCKSDLAGLPEQVPMAQPLAEASPVLDAVPPVAPFATPAAATASAMALTSQPTAPAAPAPVVEPPAQAPAAAPLGPPLPAGAQPKMVVLRGLRVNVEYPLFEGENYLGRTDEKPVDIDLEDQEPPDRIWSSRQHAVIVFQDNVLTVEDLNSSNGTFVNRTRVYPGQKRVLQPGDVVQIGTVQMRVKV